MGNNVWTLDDVVRAAGAYKLLEQMKAKAEAEAWDRNK